MADNINDESFDNPIIAQAENLSDDIISLNDADIKAANQETEIWKYIITQTYIINRKRGKNIFLNF